jgi:hypothetical protein
MLKTMRKELESYEVYDEQGNSVGRVTLATRRRKGDDSGRTVYLRRDPSQLLRRASRAA